MQLYYQDVGEGAPLIVMHGLFGSSTNWRSIAKQLATKHRVLSLDLRNHGQSPHVDTMSYPEMVEDVRELMESLDLGACSVIGHSVGGKVAMNLALMYPELVTQLMVVDIAPALYTHTFMPLIEAMQRVDLSQCQKRSEVDEHLADEVPDPRIRLFLLQNLASDEGQLRWKMNLSAIAKDFPTLSDFPQYSEEQRYLGRTFFVGGAQSDYIRNTHHARIFSLFPSTKIVMVPDAGHWVHAEQPQAFLDVVHSFLEA